MGGSPQVLENKEADGCSLSEINEVSLLSLLKDRFEKNEFMTRLGSFSFTF